MSSPSRKFEHQKVIDLLMESDCDNSDPVHNPRIERMSQLSKLNLLGLVNLTEIIQELKVTANLDVVLDKIVIEAEQLRNISG